MNLVHPGVIPFFLGLILIWLLAGAVLRRNYPKAFPDVLLLIAVFGAILGMGAISSLGGPAVLVIITWWALISCTSIIDLRELPRDEAARVNGVYFHSCFLIAGISGGLLIRSPFLSSAEVYQSWLNCFPDLYLTTLAAMGFISLPFALLAACVVVCRVMRARAAEIALQEQNQT
ncbi:hypothetical protein KQI84_01275 [bacterium]|nr:hypothetical protein [bacterium]